MTKETEIKLNEIIDAAADKCAHAETHEELSQIIELAVMEGRKVK